VRFEDAVKALEGARTRALPGPDAQAAMAPRPRRLWVPGAVPESARPAAGLVLLYPDDGDATLLLTVRGADLVHHGGQVSLPGGAVEVGESVEQAALREAEEEVGLRPEGVAIRLRLTPLHIPVSGYVLHPVVATIDRQPGVRPRDREVARIVALPLVALSAAGGIAVEQRLWEGVAIDVPYVAVDGVKLWGATAMVVAELLAVLGAPLDPFRDR